MTPNNSFGNTNIDQSLSREGIFKYPPPLLFPIDGPEIRLHNRSIPIEILTKQHFTLIFSYQLPFSAFSSENAIPVI